MASASSGNPVHGHSRGNDDPWGQEVLSSWESRLQLSQHRFSSEELGKFIVDHEPIGLLMHLYKPTQLRETFTRILPANLG